MQESDLKKLIKRILEKKTETTNIEFKSAKEGSPEKLYDSLSSLVFQTQMEVLSFLG